MNCPSTVVHRVFDLICQITYLNPKITVIFFEYGFLSRAVDQLSVQSPDSKAFAVICEFMGRLCVNDRMFLKYQPSEFVDLCGNLLSVGSPPFFGFMEKVCLNHELLRSFCQPQFTLTLFRMIEDGPFMIAQQSVSVFALMMQEAPDLMYSTIVEYGTFDLFVRFFETDYWTLISNILAGLATMVNWFIDDQMGLQSVFQNSPALLGQLQEILDHADNPESHVLTSIVEGASLIVGMMEN
jgi:hypothetical protein